MAQGACAVSADPKGLGALFDAHTDAEFKTRDIEALMATMTCGASTHRPTDRSGCRVRRRPRLPRTSEGSVEVRARVTHARRMQIEHYAALGLARIRTNAECDGAMLEEIAAPDRAGLTLLRDAADALSLSARGYHRTLRVARTLADLDGEEAVARIHMPKP